MRDLLASRFGRLIAFFLLYVTEGIPLGFTAVAIVTQMRRRGLTPAEIGLFVASLYLPWGWKWTMGPFVDLIGSRRLGRRRVWIVATQTVMALILLAAVRVDFVTELTLFAGMILVMNAFAATMDVAIDALAVTVLPESERGLAGGLMFAGAYVGQGVGGAGVLLLTDVVPFNYTFFFVAGSILAVTFLVSLWLREPPWERPVDDREGNALARGAREVGTYAVTAIRAVFGSRAAIAGLVFALLPGGAMAMNSALGTNLQVEIGLDDKAIAKLSLVTTICAALGCVAGGFLSDRFGRRRAIAVFIAVTVVPTITLAAALHGQGYVMPGPPRPAGASLLMIFWIASLLFSFVQGLIYGSRTALFMDLCDAKVAATQFTAYMALMNLVIAYTAAWQGYAAQRWGYPATMMIDCCVALLCLAALPFMKPRLTALTADRGFPVVQPSSSPPPVTDEGSRT